LADQPEDETQQSALLQSVDDIQSTTRAVSVVPGDFLAFDELAGLAFDIPAASPDLPTAVDCYTKQMRGTYDELVKQSAQVINLVFGKVGQLDEQQIHDGLNAVTSNIPAPALGKAEVRALDIFQKAIQGLTNMIGTQGMQSIQDRLNGFFNELRTGGDAAQTLLKYSYSYDKGQQAIIDWLKITTKTPADLDAGVIELSGLNQRIVQTYTVNGKIAATLQSFSKPLKWLLKKAGLSLPVDLVLAGAYLILLDVAILQGMDYADTTTIVKTVEGIQTISKRVLGVS
jgi:hypothetical protein